MSSMKTILRSGTIVAAGAAALTLSACAGHSGNQSARYGNVYDYESGGKCASTNSCGVVSNERYGESYQTENVVYADCSTMSHMDCGAQHAPMVQTYPVAQTYPVQSYPAPVAQTYPSSDISYGGYSQTTAEAAPCPAGTTPNGDGTCMESSSSYSSGSYTTTDSYSSGTTYSDSSYGGVAYSGSSSAGMAECPAGTTSQSDGTCMQSSFDSGSYVSTPSTSYGSTTSYDSGSYGSTSSYGGTANCPAGSSAQGDGTCAMNEGTSMTNTTTYGGYTNTGSYTTNDYMPIRK